MARPSALLTLFSTALLLLGTCFAAPILAGTQKFVYVYNSQGQMLMPLNAAAQCPEPDGGQAPAPQCQGVRVDENGDYSLRLSNDDLGANQNLIFVANQYRFIPAGENPGITSDIYILLESKRRIDGVEVGASNDGVYINTLSEATVRAVEEVNKLPRGHQGVGEALVAKAEELDADGLNTAMGNGKQDNSSQDPEKMRQQQLLEARQENLTQEQEAALVNLAAIAVQQDGNAATQDYLSKNVVQAVINPAYLQEATDRVFSHVAAMQRSGGGQAVLILDADRYVMYPHQRVNLTTERSLNVDQFFAYTWHGVDSELPTADFSRDATGDYLVCATGEMASGNDSSTDCIRLSVKDTVDAIARASERRVPEGASVILDGTYSVGATKFSWSGADGIADSASGRTTWVAPQQTGVYTLTLSIDDGEDTDAVTIEVYDILPVAIAQVDKESVYLGDPDSIFHFVSASISTDGTAVDSLLWEVVGMPAGANPVLSDVSQEGISLDADVPGLYTVRLTAGKDGNADSVELMVQVREHGAPVANAGPDQVAFRNQQVTLDGTFSYGGDGRAIGYVWSAEDGVVSNANQAKGQFTSADMGDFNVTLTVDDGNKSASDVAKIEVRNRVPTASDATVANVLNELLQGLLVAQDGDGDTLSFNLVEQPLSGGVTLDAATGAFTYIPGGDKGCRYHPYARPHLNDQGGQDVPVIKLCADKYVVAPGEVVNLTTSDSINASKFSGYTWINAEGDANDITKATFVSDVEGEYEVCVVGNIGQSKNTSTACVEITVDGSAAEVPSSIDGGYVDCFKYSVNDGMDTSNAAKVCLTIGWENSIPTMDDASYTLLEDHALSGTFVAQDVDDHPLTYHIGGDNPALGDIHIDAFTGNFSYAPHENANGTDVFTILVHDGLAFSAPVTVTINITPVNDVPVAFFAGSVTTLEDTSVGGVLGAQDPDADVLEFRLVTQGKKGDVVIDPASGAFTYHPHLNENGSDSFYFVVNDGTLDGNLKQVLIDITPVNDAPEAHDVGPLSVHKDEVLEGNLDGRDVDGDALAYQLVTGPAKGTLKLDPGQGTFVFTPSGSQLGQDSFTYRVNDGLLESGVATVNLNIMQSNTAPIALAQVITVLENTPYGGVLEGMDAEGAPLSFSLANAPFLGKAEITNKNTGAFTYTAKSGGSDFFTFNVSDGDKASALAKVSVSVVPESHYCGGPGSVSMDADADGYADFVEAAFNTRADDKTSTPLGLDAKALGVTFQDDDDSDGFADYVELWLGTKLADAASVPTKSTRFDLPPCMTLVGDYQAPVLQGFQILTPVVNADTGLATARFAITAIENAAGVKSVEVKLQSPSGAVVSGHLAVQGAPKVLFAEFDSEVFSQYAEAGVWMVEELRLKDSRGNESLLAYHDLKARGFAHELTVVNPQWDGMVPEVLAFDVLTPVVDLGLGENIARFHAEVTDNVSGIAKVFVKLQSPSGDDKRWAEAGYSGNQTSISVDLNSNAFDSFAERGVWLVTQLDVVDEAGNRRKYTTAGLQAMGFATQVQVINSTLDVVPPSLDNFEVLTPYLDVTPGGVSAGYHVAASDGQSGIRDVVVTLSSPSGNILLGSHHAAGRPAAVDVRIDSEAFAANAERDVWLISQVDVSDAAGNVRSYSTGDLMAAGFSTEVVVICPPSRCYGPHWLWAESMSVETDEDVPYNGILKARDSMGHELSYEIITNGRLGTAKVIDSATGEFVFTPKANAFGTDVFTFRVDDGTYESYAGTVSVTIHPVNDAPIARNMEIKVVENQPYLAGLEGRDVDGDPLTYSLVSNGNLGSAAINDSQAGSFSYTPNANTAGDDTFTYVVSDGQLSSEPGTVTVHIKPEFGVGAFKVVTPVVNNKDPNVWIIAETHIAGGNSKIAGAWLTLTGPSGQTIPMAAVNLNLDNESPIVLSALVDTTSMDFEAGTWHFNTLKVLKQGAVANVLVAGDIGAAGFDDKVQVMNNASPVCGSKAGNGFEVYLGQTYNGNLLASDSDGNALKYRIVGNGNVGTATLSDAGSGAFKFTPSAIGTGTFSYQVNDGLSDATQNCVVSVKVNPPGVLKALDARLRTNMNVALVANMQAYDPDGHTLSFQVQTQPVHGRLMVSNGQTGEFSYHPDTDYAGSDSFTFNVSDGINTSNTATVTLAVVEPNIAPLANNMHIRVLQGASFEGLLAASDANGDTMCYHVDHQGSLGHTEVNSATGAFSYQAGNTLGRDYFVYSVCDGKVNSNQATVWVDILSLEQICGTGGYKQGFDSDADGWADVIEQAFGTVIDDATDTPAGLDAEALGINFADDDDGDGFPDYHEIWLGSDAKDSNSTPDAWNEGCFRPSSDGIKPRLLGFKLVTPSIDLSDADPRLVLDMTLMDNASGLRRARVSLLSPSGVMMTSSASFDSFPLLTGLRLQTESFDSFAEQGIWQITSITLFDEAGNRLDIKDSDMLEAGFSNEVSVINANGDVTAPSLDNFSILTPDVYPGTAADRMAFDITLSDAGAGVSSARIDMVSPSGVIVSAVQTLAEPLASVVMHLETPLLSSHLEEGVWHVHSVLVVDGAGNSRQYADDLAGMGFATSLHATNPQSDNTAPGLSSFSVLTPEVFPATGTARMQFAVKAADDKAGVAEMRVDLRGPSGQILYAWAQFSDGYPLDAEATVETSVLSQLLEMGEWQVEAVHLFDEAGNENTFREALANGGTTFSVLVSY